MKKYFFVSLLFLNSSFCHSSLLEHSSSDSSSHTSSSSSTSTISTTLMDDHVPVEYKTKHGQYIHDRLLSEDARQRNGYFLFLDLGNIFFEIFQNLATYTTVYAAKCLNLVFPDTEFLIGANGETFTTKNLTIKSETLHDFDEIRFKALLLSLHYFFSAHEVAIFSKRKQESTTKIKDVLTHFADPYDKAFDGDKAPSKFQLRKILSQTQKSDALYQSLYFLKEDIDLFLKELSAHQENQTLLRASSDPSKNFSSTELASIQEVYQNWGELLPVRLQKLNDLATYYSRLSYAPVRGGSYVVSIPKQELQHVARHISLLIKLQDDINDFKMRFREKHTTLTQQIREDGSKLARVHLYFETTAILVNNFIQFVKRHQKIVRTIYNERVHRLLSDVGFIVSLSSEIPSDVDLKSIVRTFFGFTEASFNHEIDALSHLLADFKISSFESKATLESSQASSSSSSDTEKDSKSGRKFKWSKPRPHLKSTSVPALSIEDQADDS